MKTSAAGLDLIKRNEGCELNAFLDTVADPPVWTIGYGETGQYVYQGLRFTQDQADMGLARRLRNEFEPGVLEALHGAPVTQAQFDALVSLEWNIGVGRVDDPETPQNEGRGLKGSSVIRYHLAGDYARAADAFRLWNKAGGVVNKGLMRRREEERALYLTSGASDLPVSAPAVSRTAVKAAVRVVQTLLQDAGEHVGEIDGIWGPQSETAILGFQARVK